MDLFWTLPYANKKITLRIRIIIAFYFIFIKDAGSNGLLYWKLMSSFMYKFLHGLSFKAVKMAGLFSQKFSSSWTFEFLYGSSFTFSISQFKLYPVSEIQSVFNNCYPGEGGCGNELHNRPVYRYGCSQLSPSACIRGPVSGD